MQYNGDTHSSIFMLNDSCDNFFRFYQYYFINKITEKYLLLKIGIYSISFVFILYQIGILGTSVNNYSEGGFGLYHLNLVNFINPLFVHSPFLPSYLNENDFEGYCYLGFGTIILYLFEIAYILRNKINIINNYYIPLFIALCLFLLFSFGSTVSFFKYNLYLFNGDSIDFFSMFRANGRFIWSVYYSIIIFSIYLYNKISITWSYKKYFFIVVLMAINLYEISEYMSIIRPKLYKNTYIDSLRYTSEVWQELRRQYNTIRLLNRKGIYPNNWQQISYIASKFNFATNVASLARMDTNAVLERDDADFEILKNENFSADTIYIFDDKHIPIINKMKNKDIVIACLDGLHILLPNGVKFTRYSCVPNEKIFNKNDKFFISKNNSIPLFSGWSDLENDGVWSDSYHSRIVFDSSRPLEKIVLELHPYTDKDCIEQKADIYVNNILSKRVKISNDTKIYIDVKNNMNTYYEIELVYFNAKTPKKIFQSADSRLLSIKLRSIEFY